jgi:hypothetical protein
MQALIDVWPFIRDNQFVLAAMAAIVTFSWSVWQYFDIRRRDYFEREFKEYHRLIQELVQPSPGSVMYLDREAAVVFELRRFNRYNEFTVRTLETLKLNWASNPAHKRLIDEIEITIAFLLNKSLKIRQKKIVFTITFFPRYLLYFLNTSTALR